MFHFAFLHCLKAGINIHILLQCLSCFLLIALRHHKCKCDIIGILLLYYLKNIIHTEVAVMRRWFPGISSIDTAGWNALSTLKELS